MVLLKEGDDEWYQRVDFALELLGFAGTQAIGTHSVIVLAIHDLYRRSMVHVPGQLVAMSGPH